MEAREVLDIVEKESRRRAELEKVRPLAEFTLEAERAEVLRVIALCDGNKVDAAIKLRIGRQTLYRKIGGK